MPSRGSYRVANLEEGKRLERDHSFRSCMLTLIIFSFLCLVLLLATLPWKLSHTGHYDYRDRYLDSEEISAEPNRGIVTTTENARVITKDKEKIGKILFERYSSNVTSTPKSSEIVTEISSLSMDKLFSDITTSVQDITTGISFETEPPEFTNSESTEPITIIPTNRDIESTSVGTTDNYIYESTSKFTSSTAEESTGTLISTRQTIETGTETIANEITEFRGSETQANTESVNIITESHYQSDATWTRDTEDPSGTTSNSFATTSPPINDTINEQICLNSTCMRTASKMLFYMNHSSDPCDDFYEYACGGFEADPQTIDRDLENIAHQRIAKEMRKNNRRGVTSSFSKYYNSCLDYEAKDISERVALVKRELSKIGRFYTTANWHENQDTITDLLAKLLLHHSPLLFDIAPDLNERIPEQYTLKIGPTTYKDPFETASSDDECFSRELEGERDSVDLKELYREYRMCKKDTKKYVSSIGEALTRLGAFDDLTNQYNISQYIQTTVINIDLEIIQKYYAVFPSTSEIREAYLMKNYTYVLVKNLGGDTKLVNWTRLISRLTGKYVIAEGELQVYFHDQLIRGLRSLEEFGKRDSMQLYNALLGLHARNLYQVLVLKQHKKLEDHCLRVATNLLIPEASSLYVSSFSEDELDRMNRTIHQIFESLKETLKINVAAATWTTEEGRRVLEKKVDDLKLATPDVSYFIDGSSTFKNSTSDKFYLSDNYVENSMILVRRYRTLIYTELFTSPRDPEQIWTHYATPFGWKGLAIYGLNLVVIPFGVVDWSTVVYDSNLHYLNLATLGTVVARQIAHHFDANDYYRGSPDRPIKHPLTIAGIYYWNEMRENNSFLSENESANLSFEEYISCQKSVHFQSSMKLTLPVTGQIVSYRITQLTLNERLSDAIGLRLAYDTLNRLRSSRVSLLPWLGNGRTDIGTDQLFYLAYAQMHCTKVPLTSSYVALFENEELPSRIRIILSGSSNQHLGETWSCPSGSGMVPSYACSVFPYLQSNDLVNVDTE